MKGKYEVSPGLKPLGTDCGMGASDKLIFQIGNEVEHFLENKQACRNENLQKYFCTYQDDLSTMHAVNDFIVEMLVNDYPDYFHISTTQDYRVLHCNLTGEEIKLSPDYQLIDSLKYISLFDALCAQVPEDMAVWQVKENTDWLAALHICAPNHWAPQEKIGRNFSDFHAPVPGLEGLRKRYFPMLQSITDKGSFVRFTWGLSTDCHLNHHPIPPPSIDKNHWQGRSFNPYHPELYIRTERQTLTGFQDENAVLFTIRTYFTNVASLSGEELEALASAIQSMSPASLVYKGLDKSKDEILEWLNTL